MSILKVLNHFKKGNVKKKVGIILLDTITLLAATGCVNISEAESFSKQQLEQKYGIEFDVELTEVGANEYIVIANPSSDTTMHFSADVEKHGNYLYDRYIPAKLGRDAEELIAEETSNTFNNYEYYVNISGKNLETSNINYTIDDYIKDMPDESIVITIIVEENEFKSRSQEYFVDYANSIASSYPTWNGAFAIYCVSPDIITELTSLKKTKALQDNGFKTSFYNKDHFILNYKDGMVYYNRSYIY